MFLKRANASLSFPPPIYKPSMEEARWGAVSLRNACPSAQHSGQMLAFEGKTRSHSRAFTISLTGSSCCPAVYSAGPVAIAIGTALRRVPGPSHFRRADLLFSLSETSSIQASHDKVPEPM